MWLSLFWKGNKSSNKNCTWKLLINKSHRNAHFDRHSAENVMFQFVWMLLTEMNSTLFLERLINVSIEVFIHTNVSWISHTIMWWPVPIRMNGIRSPKKETYLRFFFWVFLLKINGVERNTSAFSNETSTFTLFYLNLVLNLTQTPDSPKKSALFSIYFRFFTICTETSQLANKLRNGLTFQRAHHRSCVLFLLHWHRVRLQPAQRLVDVWLLL